MTAAPSGPRRSSGSYEAFWFLGVCLLAAAFAARLGWLGFWRYDVFRAGVDEGIFTQVVAGLFSGFSSSVEGGFNHLLVHWSPILALCAPFVRAFGGAKGLIVLQSLLIASTALPAYGIARTRTPPAVALAVAGIALLYPLLWLEAFGDFHENVFAPVLSATLVWTIHVRRWRAGIVAAGLLACVKEDEFVILAFAGLVLALWSKEDVERRDFGLAVVAIATLGAMTYFGVVRHALHPYIDYWSLHYYDWSYKGPSPQGTVALGSPQRLLYLYQAFAPLLFLPLGSRYILFAVPAFAELLASHEGITLALGAHYTAAWSGFAVAAFADTASRIWSRNLLYGLLVLGAGFVTLLRYHHDRDVLAAWYYLYRAPSAHDRLLESTLDTIPAGVGVGTEDQIFAHLGMNPTASITMAGQPYFVFDRSQYSRRWHDVDGPLVARLLRTGVYRKVFERDDVVVLRRLTRGS